MLLFETLEPYQVSIFELPKKVILSEFSCVPVRSCRNEIALHRSSHPEVFCKKIVLENFGKFSGKHLCESLCFNEVAAFYYATLFKRRLQHRCFPVKFRKFLRAPFCQTTSRRLLLTLLRNRFMIIIIIYRNNWCRTNSNIALKRT